MKVDRRASRCNTNADFIAPAISIWVFPREELNSVQWLVNVADKVKKPGERDSSLNRLDCFTEDALILGNSSEDVEFSGCLVRVSRTGLNGQLM
jgi:hypothetical protein